MEDGDEDNNDDIFNAFSALTDNNDGSRSSPVGVGVRNEMLPPVMALW